MPTTKNQFPLGRFDLRESKKLRNIVTHGRYSIAMGRTRIHRTNAARQRAYRLRLHTSMNVAYTSTIGHNARAFGNICKLYIQPDSRVLDATYGMGGFWRIAKDFWLRPTFTDIQQRPGVHIVADANALPFPDSSFDAVILDPPYRRDTRENRTNVEFVKRDFAPRYGLDKNDGQPWTGIVGMYRRMITEAKRVVVLGGLVIVKGMDDKTQWFVRDLPTLGMKIIDVHVVTMSGKPMMRHDYQVHARKNHSYFVVLRKRTFGF